MIVLKFPIELRDDVRSAFEGLSNSDYGEELKDNHVTWKVSFETAVHKRGAPVRKISMDIQEAESLLERKKIIKGEDGVLRRDLKTTWDDVPAQSRAQLSLPKKRSHARPTAQTALKPNERATVTGQVFTNIRDSRSREQAIPRSKIGGTPFNKPQVG